MIMPQSNHLEPTIIVIFGAGGDLTWRKLVPALYNLLLDHHLPERCAIVGVARKPLDDETFRKRIRDGVDRFSRRGTTEEAAWRRFAESISYVSEDLVDPASGTALSRRLGAIEEQWGLRANRVYYLAVPPDMMEPAASMLQRLGVCKDCSRDRLVVEKPFGRDFSSARSLNRFLNGMFVESQIYRIDHYLGKETVQNILAFRFANSLYEPI
jgi:glucose-6-phosphate 1-dehydrogenase